MSALEATPGPWVIEPQGKGARGHWFQRESDGEYIAMSCRLNDRAEEDANANLIAASPDLYHELDHLAASIEAENERGIGVSGALMSDVREARALLAKARGEQAA